MGYKVSFLSPHCELPQPKFYLDTYLKLTSLTSGCTAQQYCLVSKPVLNRYLYLIVSSTQQQVPSVMFCKSQQLQTKEADRPKSLRLQQHVIYNRWIRFLYFSFPPMKPSLYLNTSQLCFHILFVPFQVRMLLF